MATWSPPTTDPTSARVGGMGFLERLVGQSTGMANGQHNGSDIPSDDRYLRPDGVSDETVDATGRLSEALEWIERARGHLYDFHQMMGHADEVLGAAADLLREAGHPDQGDRVDRETVGRNVVYGRWTFQVVDEFDEGYYATVKDVAREIEQELMAGRRHVFEGELKEQRRTGGKAGHEARP